ncbi:MAG TPA: hypothetical protein DCX52_03590 [Massilia sp.]|nr:hypothetical protein [Massilia sp.]
MKLRNFLKCGLAVIAFAVTLGGCGGSDDDENELSFTQTIAVVAKEQGFNAFVAAVTKASIGSFSDPNAQLTVFAPTDQAFDTLAKQLGFADATAMVNALPADTLQSILSYHVLGSKKLAADLSAGGPTQETAYTFENAPATLRFDFSNGAKITDAALTVATIVTPDIPAGNSVIHAIDKVLIPPGLLNIFQMAQVNPLLSSLVSALVVADLQGTLGSAGQFTVFAPTNAAFPAAPLNFSTAQLRTILTYHVVLGQVLSTQIPYDTPVPTVSSQTISFVAGTPPAIRDTTSTLANIVAVDVRASNGVIHVIDKVLIPTL